MISTMRKNKRTSYVSKKERSQLEKIQGISVRVTKNEIDINNSSFQIQGAKPWTTWYLFDSFAPRH